MMRVPKPPHIVSVLPVGSVHPRLHVSILERYAKQQTRRNRPIVPYDPDRWEKRYRKKIIKVFRKGRSKKEWSRGDVYEAVAGFRRCHPNRQTAILNGIAYWGRRGLIQYINVNVKFPHKRFIQVGNESTFAWEYHWAEEVRFRYVPQKPGPKKSQQAKKKYGALGWARVRLQGAERAEKIRAKASNEAL